MLIRAFSFWHGGGGGGAPDVEFLSAIQVAETDGTTSVTTLSGSYTPHVDAEFVLGIMMARNSTTLVNGSAMSLNGVSMGAALSTDDSSAGGGAANGVTIHTFGTSSPATGTLAYTRSAGTLLGAQLWGASFRYVDSVGTPVKATGTTSPAQATITPTAIGDMLVVIVIVEPNAAAVTPADNLLTPVNCTERLDLFANAAGGITEDTMGGLGTLLADVVAGETLGFSFTDAPANRWSCHAIPLLKA